MSPISRIAALPMREQLELARMIAIRSALELLLKTIPLKTLCAKLGIRIGDDDTPPAAPLNASLLADADRRALTAARRLFRRRDQRSCLRHSLLVDHALRAHNPVLRIGAARVDGRTTAHSWIEIPAGRIDLDPSAHYVPLRAARPQDEQEW